MKKFIILSLSTVLAISPVNWTFANSIYVQSSETEYKFISNFENSDEYMDISKGNKENMAGANLHMNIN